MRYIKHYKEEKINKSVIKAYKLQREKSIPGCKDDNMKKKIK